LGSKSFFRKFSVFDLVIIGMVSAMGIAMKPVIVPLVQIITGPLFIPGGAVAGGFYMMWIVIGAAIIKKRGTAVLIGAVQAIMVIAMGTVGTHGIMSIATYIAPGVSVEVILWLSRERRDSIFSCFFAGMAANMTGVLLSNLVFFKLPLIPLILSIAGGALSGGLGGLVAFLIIRGFKRVNAESLGIFNKK